MAPRPVSPCACWYRPPNPSCPQKHHLSICRRHTGGTKFLPCSNKNFLDKVCRKRSPARLHRCQVCRGSIPKCRPPLGRKNIAKQNLSLETEPLGTGPHFPPTESQGQKPRPRPLSIPVMTMFLTSTGLETLDHTEKAVVFQKRTLLPRFSFTYNHRQEALAQSLPGTPPLTVQWQCLF